MSSSSKLHQRVKKAAKRRDKAPRRTPKTIAPVTKMQVKRIASAYDSVVIELGKVAVGCHYEDPRIDDATVVATMARVILLDPPDNLPHAWLYSKLLDVKANHPEIGEEDFHLCLRTTLEFAKRQSTLQPGDTTFLDDSENLLIAFAEDCA